MQYSCMHTICKRALHTDLDATPTNFMIKLGPPNDRPLKQMAFIMRLNID